MSLSITLTGHALADDGSVPPPPLPLASAHCVLASAPPAAALRAFATSLFAALAPGAPLEAQCAPAAPPAFTPAHSAELWRALCAQLVLAGFVEVCDVGRSGGSGEGAAWGVAARKPAWAGSGGAPLRGAALRGRAVGTPAPAPAAADAVEQGVVLVGAAPSAAAAAAAAWGAAAASGGSGAQLVDEDALLAGEDFTEGKAAAGGGEAGCATKRKACANCSCGRKEVEQAAEAGQGAAPGAGVPNPKAATATSSCGNCSKGDAFRCAGCPYLGQPAFSTDASGAVMLKL